MFVTPLVPPAPFDCGGTDCGRDELRLAARSSFSLAALATLEVPRACSTDFLGKKGGWHLVQGFCRRKGRGRGVGIWLRL